MSVSTELPITTAQKLELWPPSRLVPYARNARTHTPEQVRQVADSIRAFGFNSPILVDSKDGILAGHCRLAAAKELGLEVVPVVVLDHLTPAQRKAYILADNRIAQNAGWDRVLLNDELAALAEDDIPFDLLGFDADDMRRLADSVQLAALEAMAGTVQSEPESGGDDEEEEEEQEENTGSGEVYHTFAVSLLWNDREEVLATIRAAKEKLRCESTADALLHICREFNR